MKPASPPSWTSFFFWPALPLFAAFLVFLARAERPRVLPVDRRAERERALGAALRPRDEPLQVRLPVAADRRRPWPGCCCCWAASLLASPPVCTAGELLATADGELAGVDLAAWSCCCWCCWFGSDDVDFDAAPVCFLAPDFTAAPTGFLDVVWRPLATDVVVDVALLAADGTWTLLGERERLRAVFLSVVWAAFFCFAASVVFDADRALVLPVAAVLDAMLALAVLVFDAAHALAVSYLVSAVAAVFDAARSLPVLVGLRGDLDRVAAARRAGGGDDGRLALTALVPDAHFADFVGAARALAGDLTAVRARAGEHVVARGLVARERLREADFNAVPTRAFVLDLVEVLQRGAITTNAGLADVYTQTQSW